MTTETIINAPTDAPTPKRKYAPRRKRRVAAPKVKVPKEFEGMTAMDCCGECTEKRCVITGIGICGHPMKGGLQAPLMVKPEIVARYNRAKKVLEHAKLDLRLG